MADICCFPGSCLPGRCIAAEAAASPNFSLFSSWRRSELALAPLAPHCPPELALLRVLPDYDPEPPDRQPIGHRPRRWARGSTPVGLILVGIGVIAAIGLVLGIALGQVIGP